MAYSVTHETGLRINTTKQDHRKPLPPWLCPRLGLFGQLTAQKSAYTQQAICEAGKKGNGQEHLMRKKDEAGHTLAAHHICGQDKTGTKSVPKKQNAWRTCQSQLAGSHCRAQRANRQRNHMDTSD